MFCKKCGYELSDKSKFCPKCGAKNEKAFMQKDFQSEERSVQEIKQEKGDSSLQVISDNAPVSSYTFDETNSIKSQTPKITIKQVVLSLVCCLLMFVLLFTSISLLSVRLTLSDSHIYDSFDEDDYILNTTINTSSGSKEISDYILSNISQKAKEKNSITKSDIQKLLQNENVKNYLKNSLSDYTNLLVFGKDTEYIKESKIIDFIKRIDGSILTIGLSDDDYDQLSDQITEGDLWYLTETGIQNHLGLNIKVFPLAFSLPTICVLSAVSLLLIILVFLINKSHIKLALSFNGVFLMFLGIICIIFSAVVYIIAALNPSILTSLLKCFSLYFFLLGLAPFIISFFMLLIKRKYN